MLHMHYVMPGRQCTALRYSSLSLLLLVSCSALSEAANAQLEVIEVKGLNWQTSPGDSQQLLRAKGVDFSAAGGVSALPVLNGMMGNRIKVLIDGSDIGAACANEMNPPLSYISANQINAVTVVAGISPVSMGGDNIAGVISVSSFNPGFSDSDKLSHQRSYLGNRYQSNGDAVNITGGTEFSSKQFSLKYDGAYSDANSYRDGNDDKVPDTLYRAQNHQLVGAWQDGEEQLAVKLSHQYIPFQGFANQYMDMTENQSFGATLQYQRPLADGDLLARVNWQGIKHEMGFFSAEKPGTMPMLTDSDDYSYQLHWQTAISNGSTLKVGHEFYQFRLNDIWPAVPGSMMMGPNDYININDGKRRRLAIFAELNQQLTAKLLLNYGARLEQVSSNTGDVQAYNNMMMGMMAADAVAAQAFNQQDRKQSDTLADLSFSASYQLDDAQQLQFGLAQKNRAPNLYERYSWGQGQMAITMIGWFGDGNGYIGDINLKPETARTLSIAYLYSSDNTMLQLRPFYTKVADFIDVSIAGNFNTGDNLRHRLQFVNLDATLYGIGASGQWLLASDARLGQWQLQAEAKVNRATRDNSNEPLYQQRPFNTSVQLQHQLGKLQTALKWQWQDGKSRLDSRRLENPTASYALLDLNSQWQHNQLTLSFGISNLLDKDYELPLGGVNIAEYRQDNSNGFSQLKGAGRSVNAGIRFNFM
ncbi:TonB-dependent siderophore receptor [Rheinheimera sp.]|uniref:TonB-dependent receptor plug domain-containing protein n=1 Tax=Rheinheimera sp. TaxID=1869214 RepID=UPI0027357221|nr:TonB-dependent receptor [Rheinheimera sp.]MDP2713760.1 TonB-dependent receptor [Rheinheimera sp.]